MKIAVSTDDNKNVSRHVVKCKGFIIFTVENGEIKNKEFRENIFTHHGRGGGGHHHDGKIDGRYGYGKLASGISDCSYLICQGCGWKLVEDLKQAGIKPIITRETDAETAAVKFEKCKLEGDEDLICKSD
jgi:predicted Fe-Mo cluster-binding NifX family protein